jgi:hypothetical protein
MEIGSFLELELRDSGEFYQGETDVARMNTGRSAILHSVRLQNTISVHVPFYLCPTVKNFLGKNRIKVIPYHINEHFEPILSENDKSTSVLIVNYFGMIRHKILIGLSRRFHNVIIDNCPAFFNLPIDKCFNIYSARKFFGVPDGSYVVGNRSSEGVLNYQQDSSSETSAFLLKRIEKGSSAVYSERMQNEERLDRSDILRMSTLTRRILKSIDYEAIRAKRLENFNYVATLFRKYNILDPDEYRDENCVPLVYPLLVRDPDLVNKLKERKIYTGRWWNSVLKEVDESCFETVLSKYMVPVPVDQRYGKKEIDFIFKVFKEVYTP